MPKSKEFVSSSSSEDSGSDSEPRSKKRKAEKPEKAEKAEKQEKPEKKKSEEKPKAKASSSSQRGSDGEQMFQLSRNRYATVNEFRGRVMVSIREYYEAGGDLKPGKKGITMPLDQWNRLKDQIEDIDQAVREMQS